MKSETKIKKLFKRALKIKKSHIYKKLSNVDSLIFDALSLAIGLSIKQNKDYCSDNYFCSMDFLNKIEKSYN